MKSYQIHFIRHGITDGNLAGKYIGSTDLPLCSEGISRIRELSEKYDYPGAGAFITSPMLRCRQTMELLYPDAKHIEIDGLRECDFGEFEGMTVKELEKSKDFAQWISAGADFAPLGGESGEHFSSRVFSAFESIVKGLMKIGVTSTVIVTHGGVISMLLSRYGLPQADTSEWACEPGCGYSVRIHPQLWMSGQVMEIYDTLPLIKRADDENYDM